MYAYLKIVEIQVLEIQFRLMYMASTSSEGPSVGIYYELSIYLSISIYLSCEMKTFLLDIAAFVCFVVLC